MTPCPLATDYQQDNDTLLLSEIVTADVAQQIIALANAESLKHQTKVKAREASKTAKSQYERLQELLRHAKPQEATAPPFEPLPPITRDEYMPYVRTLQKFYSDRAQYCPEYGPELVAMWRVGLENLPNYANSENNRLRGTCPVPFILGAWVQWMQYKAYEITNWK